MSHKQSLVVEPGTKVNLSDYDPRHVDGDHDKASAKQQTKVNAERLAELGYRLYAEDRRSLLLVLQGSDTSGKDGTIRHVMRGFNPQSCRVTSFKQPSAEELDHDFLWRIHKVAPRRGNIGIFNRSHYEDVLVVRVDGLISKQEWTSRYELINMFERSLVEEGTTIVKCFLHISREEQRERLQARLDHPHKRWKFNKRDLEKRTQWDAYVEAYEDALTHCSTAHAPWHIIPSDRKWARNLAVSNLLLQTIEKMNPQFPPASPDLDGVVID